ncbi:36009_t:CDS:2, partial [Gigaspora margarita]
YGEMPKLLQKNPTNTKAIFETINIKNTANYDKIQMPEIKHSHSRLLNNKHIHSADENKENNIGTVVNCDKANIPMIKCGQPPKSIIEQSSNNTYLPEVYSSLQVPQEMILKVHDPVEPECLQNYWFYTPECAQLASDTFNVPVVIFGADPITSLYFLPFGKKLANANNLSFCNE